MLRKSDIEAYGFSYILFASKLAQRISLGFDVDEFFDNAVARSNEIMEGLSGENGITSDSW